MNLIDIALGVTALAASAVATDDNFVVHEWGTFNQFEGADGFDVDGLQNEDEPLPDFVHRRLARTASPFRVYGDDSDRVPARHVHTKMETPVIYFHSKSARHVRVDVTWYRGLLTEWYPGVNAALPPLARDPLQDVDVRGVSSSTLSWNVDVLPPYATAPSFAPVDGGEPWALARDVDANDVVDRATNEAERYLFYRGIGARGLPVRVVAVDGPVRIVTNTNDTPIPAAVVVEIEQNGAGRYVVLDAPLAANAPRVIDLDASAPQLLGHDALVAAIQRDMQNILAARGLYDDEARAMVKTWTRTWFTRPGRRVLAIVPDSIIHDSLRLDVDPKPTSLVRVFVSRVEYETPADQRALVDAVLANDEQTLARRGRFLEPELRVALRDAADAADADRANALRRELVRLTRATP